jgi:hypothetical protein
VILTKNVQKYYFYKHGSYCTYEYVLSSKKLKMLECDYCIKSSTIVMRLSRKSDNIMRHLRGNVHIGITYYVVRVAVEVYFSVLIILE